MHYRSETVQLTVFPVGLAFMALCLCVPVMTWGCIWDRDTLAMERAKFPQINELIVGYFPRHSKSYYIWRAEQIRAKAQSSWMPEDYDDLAASYDKLGQHDQAIETIQAKMTRYPEDGKYESHANLGTFYIHAGQYGPGLEHITEAIQINPDAHFGREVYQKLLVEYVKYHREAGRDLPLMDGVAMFHNSRVKDEGAELGFAWFLMQRQGITGGYEAEQKEIKRAIKGITGMMRFGHYESPILLEALGDLLTAQSATYHGPQRLAARAYLKAAFEVADPTAKKKYRNKAKYALSIQQNDSLDQVESQLLKEIREGDAYFKKIAAQEEKWIQEDVDVDALFKETYYEQTPALAQSSITQIGSFIFRDDILTMLFVGVGVAALILYIFSKKLRAAQQSSDKL